MAFTVEEVKTAIKAFDGEYTYDNFANTLTSGSYGGEVNPTKLDVPNLGEVELISFTRPSEDTLYQDEGGPVRAVFSLGEQFFEIEGYFDSYDGKNWDGQDYVYEVFPREVVTVIYSRDNS